MPRAYAKPLPPLEYLQSIFAYDPETGSLTWRLRRGGVFPGSPAGHRGSDGYLLVRVDCVKYGAHRLCYSLGKEELVPVDQTIDHVNGIKYDNRLKNLRLATNAEQQRNKFVSQTRTRDNRHLPLGVERNGEGYRAAVEFTDKGNLGKRKRVRRTYSDYLQAGYAAALLRDHYHGPYANHGVDTPQRFHRLIDPPDISDLLMRFPELD